MRDFSNLFLKGIFELVFMPVLPIARRLPNEAVCPMGKPAEGGERGRKAKRGTDGRFNLLPLRNPVPSIFPIPFKLFIFPVHSIYPYHYITVIPVIPYITGYLTPGGWAGAEDIKKERKRFFLWLPTVGGYRRSIPKGRLRAVVPLIFDGGFQTAFPE